MIDRELLEEAALKAVPLVDELRTLETSAGFNQSLERSLDLNMSAESV